ncbi:protease inhibitor Inh/omp19 family protein [Chthonobacter rhizosphaerae]|uniref:protease inhibitor Inh/omp19 family protein n=1 Tax=Chthonobacter rhizosphaerae TaxID=2735553 RepID=UPI0015EF1A7C|nr:protease inhibitor Inh/omp19 family protein [Chthonobacter rhizosphaerae]
MRWTPIVSVAVTLGLAGCGGYSLTSPSAPRGPAPLPAAPTAPVQSQILPPPMAGAPLATDPNAVPAAPTDLAAAPATQAAPAAAVEVRRPDLNGGWTLASGGESCQLFMSLTTWSGGYRANTRGCASDELKSVGAWDLTGRDVVLKDASGSPVARLTAVAPARFSGQTEVSKRGVQFFR